MNRRSTQALPRSARGSAMLAALCFAAVFALCLSSYVTMCYYSLGISNRNLSSSNSIELAEDGLEDSLWALNNNTWSNWTISGSTATQTVTSNAMGITYASGTTGSVALTVANYNTSTPTITSVATLTLADGSTITRSASSTASPAPEFINAIAGVGLRVKFQGTGGLVDSYDSRLGTYAGQTAGTAAVVLSTDTSNSSATVQLDNATLDGYAITATGTLTSYTANAHVTASNVLTSANPNQPVYNENIPAYANNLPNGITSSTTLGSPNAPAPTVYYTWGDINLGSGSTLTIAGPVIIVCYGNVTVSGTGQIVIANTKVAGNYVASLELHAESGLSLGGNGINNQTLLPKRLAVLGTYSSGNSLTISQAAAVPFYGVIYFPSETVTISTNLTLYGSVVANRVLISGSPSIHYDVALQSPDSNLIDAAFNCVSGVINGVNNTPLTIAAWNSPN